MEKQVQVENKDKLVEIRCFACNKLLGLLPASSPYEIKCFRCGKENKKGDTE